MLETCYPVGAVDWADPEGTDIPVDKAAKRVLAEMLAWSTLETLSSNQIAICPVTVRPCKKSCASGSYYFAGAPGAPFWPVIRPDGQWINVWCGHRGGCGCSSVEEIVLPAPVGSIVSVVVDGVALPSTAYRVDDGNKLVRTDGDEWPTCQDFNLPAGDVGTFTVTYMNGATADSLVRYAAQLLAIEYLYALEGKKCKLPSGVTSIVRQGVSYEIQGAAFDDGFTGIREVDFVLRRYNPHALRTAPVVMSVDTMRNRPRQTTFGR